MHSQTDSREVARDRVHIVAAQPQHAADQAEVFYQAVMQGAAGHYDLAQRQQWAARVPRDAERWAARQHRFEVLVAERDGRCIGFCEYAPEWPLARIEMLYVYPSLMGQGIGSQLLAAAERDLRERKVRVMSLEASLTLSPGLARRGWHSLGLEHVKRDGVCLKRERFEKRLDE
ncbi:GNAT family N-acetyltransferase [Cobetia sp. 4B]|uniref:GNAT family N-acetyltransferase n=1 Tax=Cobetia sp. 4B TaxID=2758724 RepID=UPI001F0B00BC|nr:GNAT family N-acetyltransferase [Cobetia sp. 4B]